MKPTPEQQDRMVKRLARVEGQLRGVQKLIREAQDCEIILQQMSASRRALDKTFFEMLACMAEACILEEDTASAPARAQELRELLARYA